MRWREGFVPGGDTRFWVRETGRGDDLAVLLHGFPHDGSCWTTVAAGLAASGWRVAAPDVKGVGRTQSPPDTSYDPQTLADELSQLVRNLHGRSVLLVGHDWGGAIALATAFRHPGRIAGVVLVGSPYRSLDLRRAWHIALCNLPRVPELAFRLAPGSLVHLAGRAQTAPGERFSRDVVRAGRRAVTGAGAPGWLRYYRTLSRRAVLEDWVRGTRRRLPGIADPPRPPRLRVPAHVVWGELDPLFPLAVGEGVARDLGATMDVLRGVGHHVPVEDPSGLLDSVHRFTHVAGLGAADADAVG